MKPRLQNMLAASAALAAVAFASASVAMADGMPAAAPPAYVPPYTWTGLYIGAQSGWMEGDIKGHTVGPIPTPPGGFPAVNQGAGFKADPGTGIAGFHIGYQQQWSNIVLGVEGSLSWDFLTEEDEGQEIGRGSSGQCGFIATASGHEAACNGRIYSIRDIGPRVGFAKDKWLAYATGGFAQARINTWGTIFPPLALGTPPQTPPVSPQNRFQEGSATHDGWFVGGGVDYALSNNVFIGFQYKHYEFGSETEFTSTAGIVGSGSSATQSFIVGPARRVDATADAFMLRTDFKFSYQPTPAPMK
jgi:outer membrane immunogenic protein